ncbi:MAG: MFS transporter [Proteobacteria bacterium]|nr:MFS transporter [Pseudomonadota bacterium]
MSGGEPQSSVPLTERSQFGLLATRRFLPFFLTQFLGAFNDNVFRNALVVSIAYGAAVASDNDRVSLLANVAQALFILPFFLFSALAGQLADKYEKSRLIRQIKVAEVVLMLAAAVAFWFDSVAALLGIMFLLGAQSAAFGPLKYSLMPQHLHETELVGGNALVDTGTFLAILLGTIVGGLIAAAGEFGRHLAAAVVVTLAIAGWLASRAIPIAAATAPLLTVHLNPLTATWDLLRLARANRTVFLSILGISWFWLVGALLLAQLPVYARSVLVGDESVYLVLLASFSVGMAIGSLGCEKLSGHKVEIGLVPLGSIGLSWFVLDLYFAQPLAGSGALMDWRTFLAVGSGTRVVLDCLLIGISGGLFIVPLYALVLQRSAAAERARIIAANNVLNAAFMVAASVGAILWLEAGLTIPQLFIFAAVLNVGVATYIYTLVPEFLMRFLTWILINVLYRIRTRALDNIPESGPVLLVSNHVSLMDALVIGGSVRRPVRFVMDHRIFRTPVLRFIFRTARAIPIAPAHEDEQLLNQAFERIDAELAAGEVVCIFPEGKLTTSGDLNVFRGGVERILARRQVPVVPLALRGLWGSFFSRRAGAAMRRWPRRFWSRIELVAGPTVAPQAASATMLQVKVAELRGDWR